MSRARTIKPANDRMGKQRIYEVLVAPVVTEKSTLGSENNQITFKVAKDATKPEIKKAVEEVFKVKVQSVNTLNLPGKTKRFRGVEGKRSGIKKAVVRLEAGQNIDVSAGL